MAEDLLGNLQAYKLQLQQVEAALTTEPGNEDLQKLKNDLSEVLELTKELIKNQSGNNFGAGTSSGVERDDEIEEEDEEEEEEEEKSVPKIHWKIGNKCLAKVGDSKELRECIILEIYPDGQCSISLVGELATVKVSPSALKPMFVRKRPSTGGDDDSMPKSKKQVVLAQKEYKKKKAQKKAQRMKVLEEEREVEKGKWQNFNSKVFSKKTKGHAKHQSIFASPDNVNGRVGVGTCGIGGKPMTGYHHQEKWKKNSMT